MSDRKLDFKTWCNDIGIRECDQTTKCDDCILLGHFSKVDNERLNLQKENEALKKKLSEAVEVIKFYADRFSYSWTKHDEVEYYSATIKNDDSMVKFTEKDGTEFENLCAGKKARAFLKENKYE